MIRPIALEYLKQVRFIIGSNMENSAINLEHAFDWWKPLDPHDPGLIKARPIRKVFISFH